MSKALTEDDVAALRQKHGALYVAECDLGKVVYRHPTQADVDPYLLGKVHGREQEAANNLVFSVRVWPDVATVERMFDEAPAVVAKFAAIVMEAAGDHEDDLLGLILRDPADASAEDKASIEAQSGKPLDAVLTDVPRGAARLTTLPGFGPAIFRRPSRHSFAPFVDAAKGDGLMDAARALCAECAVSVGEKSLAEVFRSKPAVPFYLAYALAGLAGTGLEVRAGKL